jgi:hypothetical protein
MNDYYNWVGINVRQKYESIRQHDKRTVVISEIRMTNIYSSF